MAAPKGTIAKIFNPRHKGALHRALHVPLDETIPASKLQKALHSKDPHVQHMAEAAELAKHLHHGHPGEGMPKGHRLARKG